MIAREKVDSHTTAQGKEALARSNLLTENQVQDPVDSVMAINLFSVTGKVHDRNAEAIKYSRNFQRGNCFFGNFFPQLH
ncbi:MAG: hypothetical protein WC484_02885 [Candidatus Omnitrophota bacterium]